MHISEKMRIFRTHVKDRNVETGISDFVFERRLFSRMAEQIATLVTRTSAGQQCGDEEPHVDICRRQRAFPAFDMAPEFWCAGLGALGNKIVERGAGCQAPLLPRRRYPLKLRT